MWRRCTIRYNNNKNMSDVYNSDRFNILGQYHYIRGVVIPEEVIDLQPIPKLTPAPAPAITMRGYKCIDVSVDLRG